jgi:hypothetical protein
LEKAATQEELGLWRGSAFDLFAVVEHDVIQLMKHLALSDSGWADDLDGQCQLARIIQPVT